MYIKNQEIITDVGIIFEVFESNSAYCHDYTELDEIDLTADKILMQINLYSSNNKRIYHRYYLKAQEVISNLGGLAKAHMIASYLICYYFSSTKRNRQILNKIIDFDVNDSENFSFNKFRTEEKKTENPIKSTKYQNYLDPSRHKMFPINENSNNLAPFQNFENRIIYPKTKYLHLKA